MVSGRLRARFTNTVIVKTRTGNGAYGEQWAAPVKKSCYLEDVVQMVRDTHGDEVASTTRLFAATSDAAAYAVGSLVTLGGRDAKVIKVATLDAGTFSHGLDHITVYLT